MATDGTPTPGTPPDPRRRRDFLIGLGIGAMPLVLSLVAGGVLASAGGLNQTFNTGAMLGITSGALYLVMLVVMIVLLIFRATRQVGLGMLAIAAASPVIAYVGCVVVPGLVHRAP
jgi:hypothetical protein